MSSEPQPYVISEIPSFPKDETALRSCQLEGSHPVSLESSPADNSAHFPHPVHLTKNHTQTLSSMQQGSTEPGYSDNVRTDSMTLPTTSIASSHDFQSTDSSQQAQTSDPNSSYYKLDELDEDSSKSGDVMSDLLEQKPDTDPSLLEPQMLIQNVHSASQGQQQQQQQVGVLSSLHNGPNFCHHLIV